MSNKPPVLPYAAIDSKRTLNHARLAVVIIGLLLPYAMRIPGMFVYGPTWLISYFGDDSPQAILLVQAFNAINWGAILLGTLSLRTRTAVLIAAGVGFAFPAVCHTALNLSSDAQAALAFILIPIYSLPLVGVGWVLGMLYDWRRRKNAQERGIVYKDWTRTR